MGFYGSNAINFARVMINVLLSILKDILDALSFEKWESMRQIAEIEMKWQKGGSQIIVAGYRFTVHVCESTVRLMRWARDEVERAIETLKAMYGDELAKYIRN